MIVWQRQVMIFSVQISLNENRFGNLDNHAGINNAIRYIGQTKSKTKAYVGQGVLITTSECQPSRSVV